MTKWKKNRDKDNSLKYIGYNIGYQTFTWDTVVMISEVYISSYKGDIEAFFEIEFINKSKIRIDKKLEPIMITKKSFFWGKTQVIETDAKKYVDRECKDIKEVYYLRERAKNAFYQFKRVTLKVGM